MAEPEEPPSGLLRAELLSVGDELLAGDIVNGNAAALSALLAGAGVPVTRHTSIADDIDLIAAEVTAALGRQRVLVVTGGLGPTQDDLTREGIARAAGVGVHRVPELEAVLRASFAGRAREVPEMNYRMAEQPDGATPLHNPVGAAPGVRLELLGGVVYALPGVPSEMQAMAEQVVVPDLRELMASPQAVVVHVLRTAGRWESEVAEAMAPEVRRVAALPLGERPVIAFLASGGQTRVKVTASAPTREQAERIAASSVAFAMQALGTDAYGGAEDSLASVVVAGLTRRGETVAVAESLTGGLLAAALTDVAGASAAFLGSVTAYATPLKASLLGVDEQSLATDGAVAAGTAEQMAAGVRQRLGSDWALATTGVAGPDLQEGKPAGTVFLGLAGPDGRLLFRALQLPGSRAQVRMLTVSAALDLLRRALTDAPATGPAGPPGEGTGGGVG